MPAAAELKAHLLGESGRYANYLSGGSDPEHHPFTLDLWLVRLATVLVGQFVDVLSRLLTFHLLYDFSAHFDETIGVFHIPDRDRHPRVAFDVAKLLAVHLGVDQEVLGCNSWPLIFSDMGSSPRSGVCNARDTFCQPAIVIIARHPAAISPASSSRAPAYALYPGPSGLQSCPSSCPYAPE
jgi:hypothetical protein